MRSPTVTPAFRACCEQRCFCARIVFGGVGLGLGLAWLVERSDLPGREALRGLVLLPMATPPILLAIAWAMLLSPRNGVLNQALMNIFALSKAPFNIYTLPGMVFVQGLALVPTAYLFLAPAFANMDPSLEEAAMASGAGTWTLIRRIMLPILWPPILSAAIFLLIVSLVVFDVPGALGIPARLFVLSSQIYYLVANGPAAFRSMARSARWRCCSSASCLRWASPITT